MVTSDLAVRMCDDADGGSGGRSAWAWLPASYGRRCYHGSRSLSASVDSSRAGYYKTFEGAGVPEVDPILRSEVRASQWAAIRTSTTAC